MSAAFAQEKPPEIIDDLVSIQAGDTITINVMENDWCMEGHTMEIMNIWSGDGGQVSLEDSTITYESFFYFKGVDTVRYILMDQSNGLASEQGNLVVTVDNSGRDTLDVNNINALIQSYGLQFCDVADYNVLFEAPAGSQRNSVYAFNLWLAGLDPNNNLHLAAERYRQSGEDYWNGPVSETYINQQIIDYNKVWSLTKDDIDFHKQNWWQSGYEPIADIITWPAHGDMSTGQAEHLAPFNDVNKNGIYEWDKGDFPVAKGDKALFHMYNDDYGIHTESGGEKLKVEIQNQVYGFDCPVDSAFHNSIFFHYDIISRSAIDYHDFFVATFVDYDLGYPWDDFVGCDTLLDAFFVYNGDDYDEDDFTGYSPFLGYHDKPPAQAVSFLNTSLNSFMGFSNYNGPQGDPHQPEEYYNIMKGLWKDGSPITIGGNGTGGTEPTRFMYPGNPSNQGDWTEYSASNTPNDRRTVAACGPFDLNSGDTIRLDLAFVFARDYQGNYLSSVDLLKQRIEDIRWYFDNDSTPCGTPWSGMKKYNPGSKRLILTPNPVKNKLNVEYGGNYRHTGYTIYNFSGKVMMEDILQQNSYIDVSRLQKGYYIIRIETNEGTECAKFVIM